MRARQMAQMTIGLFACHGISMPPDLQVSVPHVPTDKMSSLNQIGRHVEQESTARRRRCLHTVWQHWALSHGEDFDSTQAMAHILKDSFQAATLTQPAPNCPFILERAMEYRASSPDKSLQPIEYSLGALNPNAICLALPQEPTCLLNPRARTPEVNNSPLKQWFPNASSDLFAAFMQRAWNGFAPMGARVSSEPQLDVSQTASEVTSVASTECAPALH